MVYEPSPNGVGSFLCFINMLKYRHKSAALGTALGSYMNLRLTALVLFTLHHSDTQRNSYSPPF